MKKKMITLILAGSMIWMMGACGNKEEINSSASACMESERETGTEIQEKERTEVFSFSELSQLQFSFCSGAGGWATLMHIDSEGNFTGEYFDSDMGVTGEEYPNGTEYQCHFFGKFTEPEKINDFTYSMHIAEISYEKEPGTEEIKNGTLYCYTYPYGLEGADEILLYAPGTSLSDLPDEYRSWAGYSDPVIETTGETELPFWGLYNAAEGCGFTSWNVVEAAKEYAAAVEE